MKVGRTEVPKAGHRWDETEEWELVKRWNDGEDISSIAEALGRSISACQHKGWQYGLRSDKQRVGGTLGGRPVQEVCKRGHPQRGNMVRHTRKGRECRACKSLREAMYSRGGSAKDLEDIETIYTSLSQETKDPNCSCSGCGKELYRSPSRLTRSSKVFCSTKCMRKNTINSRPLKSRTCIVCNKEYRTSEVQTRVNRFCSYQCKFIYKEKFQATCMHCSKTFYYDENKFRGRKFCNTTCANVYKALSHRETKKCLFCGETFSAPISRRKLFCSRDCQGKARRTANAAL